MTALAPEHIDTAEQQPLDLAGFNTDLSELLTSYGITDSSIAARHIVQGDQIIGVTVAGMSLFPPPLQMLPGGAS
ncbi:hypothetical protein ACGFNU_21040 [Spirillospora sp. NPDC048911]|uniref:hypothetical protein n=1 Tax=Spirillospora sp. NPDC048911 TaxID=3364527 RepID=UPI0037188704